MFWIFNIFNISYFRIMARFVAVGTLDFHSAVIQCISGNGFINIPFHHCTCLAQLSSELLPSNPPWFTRSYRWMLKIQWMLYIHSVVPIMQPGDGRKTLSRSDQAWLYALPNQWCIWFGWSISDIISTNHRDLLNVGTHSIFSRFAVDNSSIAIHRKWWGIWVSAQIVWRSQNTENRGDHSFGSCFWTQTVWRTVVTDCFIAGHFWWNYWAHFWSRLLHVSNDVSGSNTQHPDDFWQMITQRERWSSIWPLK